jgi:hypothetical protein
MLPAPTSIAAAPSPKSRASWNPAVPPPPVAGAAVGNGLADRLGDADRPGDAEGRGEADRLGEADWVGETGGRDDVEGLVLALGVVALAVPLGRFVGVAEPVAPGENVVGVAEGEDPVQAETDADASMVKAAQPTVVSLTLNPVPAMIARTFMRPPHASGRWRPHFPVPHQKRASEGPIRSRRAPAEGRVPESAEGHKGKAHRRHRHAMSCSPLKYQATRAEAPGEDGGRDHGIGGTWSGGAVISGVMVTAWENRTRYGRRRSRRAATTGRPRRLRGLADAGTDEPGRDADAGAVGDQLAAPLGRRAGAVQAVTHCHRNRSRSAHGWMLTSRTRGSYHPGESRTPWRDRIPADMPRGIVLRKNRRKGDPLALLF